jgi:hypothetical protein
MRSGGGDPGVVGYSSSASTSISMSEGRAVIKGSSTLNAMEDSGVGGGGHASGVERTAVDATETRVFPSVGLGDVFVEVKEEEVSEGLVRNELEEVASGPFCCSGVGDKWTGRGNVLPSEASGHRRGEEMFCIVVSLLLLCGKGWGRGCFR